MVKILLLFLITFYQKIFSLDHGLMGMISPNKRVCRYYPSCSEYARQSIMKYGSIIGVWLSINRLLRCNPWSKGGYDPIKEMKINSLLRIITKI